MSIIVPNKFIMTEYTKMTNTYIEKKFICNDDGIYENKKQKIKDKETGEETEKSFKSRVCDAISLINRRYDNYTKKAFLDFMFYNNYSGEYEIETFAAHEVGTKDMFDRLANLGFKIVDNKRFIDILKSMQYAIDEIRLENKGNEENIMQTAVASQSYGWRKTNTGFDFSHFVTKEDIIKNRAFLDVDGPLFEKSGTLEDWKHNMNCIRNEFKEPLLFQIALAYQFIGVIIPMLGGVFSNPIFNIGCPSSSGKKFFGMTLQTVWGAPGTEGEGLLRTERDSEAAIAQIKNRANVLGIIISDIQDTLKSVNGIATFSHMLYSFTDGTNGARSTKDGDPRENICKWYNTLLIFGEEGKFSELEGGADARLVEADTHLRPHEHFIKDNKTQELRKYQNAYGTAGPAFVEKIKEIYANDPNEIYSECIRLSSEIDKVVKQSKKSDTMALMKYVHNKLIDFGIFPDEWNKIEIEDLVAVLNTEQKTKEVFKAVFDVWSSTVKNDNNAIPWVCKKGEETKQSEYDERFGTSRQIRGRKEIDIENRKLYVYISEDNLEYQLNHTAEKLKKYDFAYSRKKMILYDLLVKNNDRWEHKKAHITRSTDKFKNETVLKIQLDLDEEITDTMSEISNDKWMRMTREEKAKALSN